MEYTSPDLAIWLDKDSEIKTLKEELKIANASIKRLEVENEVLSNRLKKISIKNSRLKAANTKSSMARKRAESNNKRLKNKLSSILTPKRSDLARLMIKLGVDVDVIADTVKFKRESVLAIKLKMKKEIRC